MEDIIAKLGNIIKSENTKFSLSLKKLHIDEDLQENFVELLAQKLYTFEKFKSNPKSKYSINIDANINEEKIEKKIQAIYFARDLQNLPANYLNPETYEEKIKETFKNYKTVKIKVIK
jgi:leucyl aminopeptidase